MPCMSISYLTVTGPTEKVAEFMAAVGDQGSGHSAGVCVRSGAGFDSVVQGEVGAGVAGPGGGEVLAEFCQGGVGPRGG